MARSFGNCLDRARERSGLLRRSGGRVLRLSLGRLGVGLKASEIRPQIIDLPTCRELPSMYVYSHARG